MQQHLGVPAGTCCFLSARGSAGNAIPSFTFTKAGWRLLRCNRDLKHLLFGHSGKSSIISTCEVQEDKESSSDALGTAWLQMKGIALSSLVHFKLGETKALQICKIYRDITKPRIGNGFDHQARWKPKQTTWPTFSLPFEHPG